MDLNAPVSDEEAITVSCPQCNAAEGEPCTYLWYPSVPRDRLTGSGVQRMLLARAGKPTKKAHNGRRLHAWQERRKRLLFENARARRIALAILREEATIRKQAGRAEREFERREWEQLREWLREHGGMLITIGNPR